MNARLPPLVEKEIATPYGKVTVLVGEKLAILKRHQHSLPPSQINHRANLAAMKIVGVDKLILILSVGGMKPEYTPGTLSIVSDYFSPWIIPTFHEHDIYHIPPSVDPELTSVLQELVPDAKLGVYLQTNGPRFETKTEIALFAKETDLVGMTGASEMSLANELGIQVAAICTVDNLANGIAGTETPTYEKIIQVVKENGDRISNLITKIIERLT